MGWTFEQIQKSVATHSGVTDICWDGRDVWVSAGTSTYVYGYWDVNSSYEFLTAADYTGRNVNDLYLVSTLATGAVRKMAVWNGKMYLLKTTTIEEWDLTTRTLTDTLTLPQAAQNVMVSGSNKLWTVSQAVDATTDQQWLMVYDLIGATWNSTLITGRKQDLNRDIIDGLDGYIYITAHNDHAIVRVDATTEAMVSVERINRHPYKLQVNQNKDVYVASDASTAPIEGMISHFNQTTDVVTSVAAAGGSLTTLWHDEQRDELWYIGGNVKLGRLTLADNDFRYTQGAALGYAIGLNDEYEGLTATSIVHGLVTPQFTYEKWNGSSFDTITVKPYLFFVSANYVCAARLNAMVRVNSFEVLGTAMIAVKAQNYYGDLT